MEKTFKVFAMALMAGAMFTACGGDDGDNGGGGGNGGGDNYPEVTITNKVQGAVKAGMADAIEVTGDGFNTEDYIFVGYETEGKMVYDRVLPEVLTLRASRVAFGVTVDASYLGKSVKVYLDRLGYDKMPITGDITFTMPTLAEGYIPDAVFRATLKANNPTIKGLFDSYGILDVNAAKNLTSGGSTGGNYALDLADCGAVSLEGIEVFEKISGVVAMWGMANIKKIDFSNWNAPFLDVRCGRGASLEELIGAPNMDRISLEDCPKLDRVDLSKSRWCRSVWTIPEGGAAVTTTAFTQLDIRRDMRGSWSPGLGSGGDYTLIGGDCFFYFKENATVKIDSWFLKDHNINSGSKGIASCWADIYNAWKAGTLTVEVYSWDGSNNTLLGTAPTFAAQPDALAPGNKDSDQKWTVVDPADK